MSTQTLAPKDHAEEVALFRSQIIGPLTRQLLQHGELAGEFEALSHKLFCPPGVDRSRTFSIPTLERWYYAYREGGMRALLPKPRSDVGHAQKLSPAQRGLLCDIRKEHPTASASLILRTLVDDGRLAQNELQESTLRRFYKEQGLDRASALARTSDRVRLRWQAERPGALWHADVCHGPLLHGGGTTQPVRIHALLDDASRYVIAIQALSTEKEQDMLNLMVAALRRHGPPDALYLDNGATYRGEALRVGCERLGITLLHARPYDAPARGKMERFWRTLRQGCLDFIGELGSLHDLNVRLWAFVDQHYHQATHGALFGKTPAQIYADHLDRPADALTEPQLCEALTVRERRRVRRDSTLSVDGHDYELDDFFLTGKVVTIVRCLVDKDTDKAPRPYVEHEGKRLELHPVDPVLNAKRKRKPLVLPSTAGSIGNLPFDPPGALLDRAVGRPPKHKESL